jgi:DDE family transposase
MSSHDTLQVASHPASAATHALIIAQTSDLVLQACGLGSTQSSDQFSQIQQGESIPRRRGRPQQVSCTQLWSSLLLCALQGMHSFADWRRLLGLQPIGPFAPVWLTRNGLVKRLLQAGLVPLQELWEGINARLSLTGSQTEPATLAAFAPEIFCLDETRLDAVGRYLKPLRSLSAHDPACFAGKLVGLFDLRAQRWLRLEWREAVQENCRVEMLDFLQGLSVGSLLLFDLGYFSFSFFDTLTQWKLWWVSRYRENTSYQIAHEFYRQHEVLDALVWLGTGQKQARHLVRLVRFGDGIGVRMYLTNVCDPQVLSMGEVAQLYARRWDMEMAFRLLKEYLGMSHWWSSKQELILVQIWVVLILSHIVYALRERIATAANCEPFEVSVPLLVELLPKLCSNSELQLERLVQEGRQLGLLRASPRLALVIPQVELSCYQSAPPDLPRQRPGRAPAAPRARAPKPTTRVCGYQVQRQRRQASKEAKTIRAAQTKAAKVLSRQRQSPDLLLI